MSDVILCKTPGCGVVIGKDGVGAKKRRRCSRCSTRIRRVASGLPSEIEGSARG